MIHIVVDKYIARSIKFMILSETILNSSGVAALLLSCTSLTYVRLNVATLTYFNFIAILIPDYSFIVFVSIL